MIKQLRNDSLRLNTGVQTEGDANRAWDELVNNLNDPELVNQRLSEIRAINRQAAEFHKERANQAREDSGSEPLTYDKFTVEKPTYGSGAAVGGDEQTATNPKTGEKIVFRGGKWQPM